MSLDLDWLISVDDHVLEPADVWQSRVPARMRDRAPQLVRDGDSERWKYEDKMVHTIGLAAVAGKDKTEFSPDPITYEDMRPSCYDASARLKDMDDAGILASLNFPSFPRFCGQVFYEGQDKELGLVCVQAWNDWMIDEWCGTAPGRYIPLMMIPLWDPTAAAVEIKRCAAKGARALAFSENPVRLGLPSIHDKDRYWDPVFAAAQDAEIVVCMHQGSSSFRFQTAEDAPYLATQAWGIGSITSGTMLDWVFSTVFDRFPRLKIALSEGGIGWIPYFLERAEQVLDKQKYWAAAGDRRPGPSGLIGDAGARSIGMRNDIDYLTLDVRERFQRHVYACFIDDRSGLANIDEIGVENVMVETDFPHSDSTWPNCITFARTQLARFSAEDTYKILRGNAERVFRFTPTAPPAVTRV